jgi:hypothetical protein
MKADRKVVGVALADRHRGCGNAERLERLGMPAVGRTVLEPSDSEGHPAMDPADPVLDKTPGAGCGPSNLSLLPSQHSSGSKCGQRAIKKAGNTTCAAHAGRGRLDLLAAARISAQLKPCLAGLPWEVFDTGSHGS